MALRFNAAATALIAAEYARRPADTVLTFSIDRIAARGAVQTLALSWSRRDAALHRGLMPVQPIAGVPILAHPRLSRYLQWHDARVTACRFLWKDRLVVDDEIKVLCELARWEYTHPGLSGRVPRPVPARGYSASMVSGR